MPTSISRFCVSPVTLHTRKLPCPTIYRTAPDTQKRVFISDIKRASERGILHEPNLHYARHISPLLFLLPLSYPSLPAGIFGYPILAPWLLLRPGGPAGGEMK